MKRSLAALLLVPLALTALAVPGQAQTAAPSVKVLFDHHHGPEILGPGDSLEIPVRTVVTIPYLQFCVVPVTVRYTARAPPFSTAIISPGSDSKTIVYQSGVLPPLPANPLETTDVVFQSRLTVSVNDAAPALYDGKYTVKADVAFSGSPLSCTLAPATAWGEIAIKNDYVPGFAVLDAHREGGDISLTIENRANGDSRYTFEYGLTGGEWSPSNRELVLESPAIHGSDAKTTGTIELNRIERPAHWNQEIRVTGQSVATMAGLETLQTIVLVPPGGGPDESAAQSLEAESYAPGPGGVGLLLALGVGLVGSTLYRRRT